MAVHIKTNSESTLVNIQTHPEYFKGEGDRGMHLKAMQELVGGPIQIIRLKKPVTLEEITYNIMGMNEEGKFSGLKFNAVATRLARESLFHGDIIVGDAILLTDEEAR